MADDFFKKASDPEQYNTGKVNWKSAGKKSNGPQQIFLKVLRPILQKAQGKVVLDVACGQGWLCDEMQRHGAEAYGIDSSRKNIELAKQQYKSVQFERVTLQAYKTNQQFDIVTIVMALEHFADEVSAFRQLGKLLKPGGQLVVIMGDFDRMTASRKDREVTVQGDLQSGKVATRTDYRGSTGIIFDIYRKPRIILDGARKAGLKLVMHKPVPVTPEIAALSSNQNILGTIYVHLITFTK